MGGDMVQEYDGEWMKGLPHGYGEMTWADGDVYDGEWKNGRPCGYGEMTYANGDVYVGNFKKGGARDFKKDWKMKPCSECGGSGQVAGTYGIIPVTTTLFTYLTGLNKIDCPTCDEDCFEHFSGDSDESDSGSQDSSSSTSSSDSTGSQDTVYGGVYKW